MWQPIETAPKDGTSILLTDGDRIVVAHWDDPNCVARSKTWCWGECDVSEYNDYAEFYSPTHWMPLPALPSTIAVTSVDSVEDKGLEVIEL